ncbi:hypothetical protein CN918_32005 [Priestia megaterium]|nr:hypothetical protein CN918_32005 [Priestia megaterium]
MFSFLLTFFSLYLSLNALNLGLKHARKSQLSKYNLKGRPPEHFASHEVELYSFLISDDVNDIFQKSLSLFQNAINRAQTEKEFGHLNDASTLSVNLYHYTISLEIKPTSLIWEVTDNIQIESNVSKRVFYMHYDRSQKKIIEEEARLNKGEKYYYCSLLEMNKYIDYPMDFYTCFHQLNNAGWNKLQESDMSEDNLYIPTEKSHILLTQCNKLAKHMEINTSLIDKEVESKINSILLIIRKICQDGIANEQLAESSFNELFHTISRLLNNELPTILQIHSQLDKVHQDKTRDMTVSTLDKALHSLSHQYAQYQQQHIQLLKQTQIVMNQRYES